MPPPASVLAPINSQFDCEQLRLNRTAFCETHHVTKKVTTSTRMKYDRARFVLGMPEYGGMGTVFDHVEIFETLDGYFIGVASPYHSYGEHNQKLFLEDLPGWETCPGMYCPDERSFYKKVPKTVTPADVYRRLMDEFFEANFEPDERAFVHLWTLQDWMQTSMERSDKWGRLEHYKTNSPRRQFFSNTTPLGLIGDLNTRLGGRSHLKSWNQVVRETGVNVQDLSDDERARYRISADDRGSSHGYFTGWKLRHETPYFPVSMRVMVSLRV